MEKENQKKSQKRMVREKLLNDGCITSWEAIQLYGATRLSAIIYDLRKEGMIISSNQRTSKNRFGNTSNYTEYTLVKQD